MTCLAAPFRGRAALWLPPLAVALFTLPVHAQTTPSAGALTLDAAVRTTLEQSPDIAASRIAVESQRGGLRQAQGAFDPSLSAGASSGRTRVPDFADQGGLVIVPSNALSYRLQVGQRFRWGMSLAPSLEVTRTDGGTGTIPYSRAELGADLTIPLLRGRGGTSAAWAETAAWRELDGSQADLLHRRSQAVLAAVLAYWDYAAAARQLDVLREAQQRAATLLAETEALIRADARPAIDAVPLRAALASKRADVVAGQTALVTARQQLAVAMGITPQQFREMPLPSTPLPTLADGDANADAVVAQALARRADLAAARSREQAARALLRGAASDRRPQLDLRVSGGWSGLESGDALRPFLTPFSEGRSGSHLSVDLQYAVPVRNRAAEGAALLRDAAGRQAALTLAELTRTISLDVLAAAETFRGAREELALATEAVSLHAQALEGERQKFRLGTSTLFDVLFAEDALTGATLAEIGARQRLAGALARLRFQSGALTLDGDAVVDSNLLTTWDPSTAASPPSPR